MRTAAFSVLCVAKLDALGVGVVPIRAIEQDIGVCGSRLNGLPPLRFGRCFSIGSGYALTTCSPVARSRGETMLAVVAAYILGLWRRADTEGTR